MEPDLVVVGTDGSYQSYPEVDVIEDDRKSVV